MLSALYLGLRRDTIRAMPEVRPNWNSVPVAGLYEAELREPSRYLRIPGRWLYDSLFISSLNRIPVRDLLNWICDGSVLTMPPAYADLPGWSLRDIIERVLVNGDTCVQDSADEGPVFLEGLISVQKDKVVQRLTACTMDDAGRPTDYYDVGTSICAVRVFASETPATFSVKDYLSYGTQQQVELQTEDYERLNIEPMPPSIPAASLHIFPWGKGILEPAGFTIQRIERIFLRQDQYTDPVNNAVYTRGVDSYESRGELDRGTKAKTRRFDLPLGSDVFRLADGTLSAALMAECDKIIPLLYAATGVVHLSETANLSGKSRQIAMFPMESQADVVRADADKFFAEFGGECEWAQMVTMDIGEIEETYDFYVKLKGDGLMGQDEFVTMSRKLAGLKPELPPDVEKEPQPEAVPTETPLEEQQEQAEYMAGGNGESMPPPPTS